MGIKNSGRAVKSRIPLAALPVWVALAFDRRTAFLFELGIAFIAASLLRFDIVLLSVLLIRGIAASLFFFNRKHPRQMVVAGTLSGFAGMAAYVCLTIIFQGHLNLFDDLMAGFSSNLIACAGGGGDQVRGSPRRGGLEDDGPRRT